MLKAWQWGFISACIGYPLLYALSSHVTSQIPGVRDCYLRLSKGGRADWDSRLPSTFLAISVVLGTYHPSLMDNAFLDNRVTHWDDRLWVPYGVTGLGPAWFMGLFVGYLLVDLATVFKHWKEIDMPMATTVHHALAGCSWSLALALHTMQWYACFWLMAELSTPLANLRWLMVKAGVRTNSNLYLFVGSWLFSTFFVVRVLPIPFVIFMFWMHDSMVALSSGGIIVLLWWSLAFVGNGLLQWYWWSLMLQALIRKCCATGRGEDRHDRLIGGTAEMHRGE